MRLRVVIAGRTGCAHRTYASRDELPVLTACGQTIREGTLLRDEQPPQEGGWKWRCKICWREGR